MGRKGRGRKWIKEKEIEREGKRGKTNERNRKKKRIRKKET